MMATTIFILSWEVVCPPLLSLGRAGGRAVLNFQPAAEPVVAPRTHFSDPRRRCEGWGEAEHAGAADLGMWLITRGPAQ
jgi:hypothetical protein